MQFFLRISIFCCTFAAYFSYVPRVTMDIVLAAGGVLRGAGTELNNRKSVLYALFWSTEIW